MIKPAAQADAMRPAVTEGPGSIEDKPVVVRVPCLICDVLLNSSEEDINQHLYEAHGKTSFLPELIARGPSTKSRVPNWVFSGWLNFCL